MSKYLINPVRAACMKHSNSNSNGIQGYNDTCFGICAAFSNTYDTYSMDPQCTKTCEEFIEQKRHEIYGVGSCDHQVPYRPVFWEQVPHYIPKLLKQGELPQNALNICKKLCTTSNLSQECQDACLVDYNAIEQFQTEKPQEKSTEKPQEKSTEKTEKPKKNIIILFTILIILILFIYISK